MPTLRGARVALLEARMSGEMSALIERFGGVPHSVPAVREGPRLEPVPEFLDALSARRFSAVVFLTGVGVTTLLDEASRLGRLDEAEQALRSTILACRGPKPVAALARHRVAAQIKTGSPHTTTELLDAINSLAIAGSRIALVHYGEPNHALADALRCLGARLEELCVYEWLMPEDRRPLAGLVAELIDRRLTAVAFTSQVQCRHLFRMAEELGSADALRKALNEGTIVAAIGPVCAATLREHGVIPDVMPAQPKLGPLVTALADYIELADLLPDNVDPR
jgi:uroporphyrinogen-III synthase